MNDYINQSHGVSDVDRVGRTWRKEVWVCLLCALGPTTTLDTTGLGCGVGEPIVTQ